MDEVRERCLALAPDLPRFVETRDLLRPERSVVLENPTREGFVVWSDARGLGCVVGAPEPRALALAAGQVPELLAFADDVDRARSLLPGFEAEPATLYAAPERLPSAPPHRCRALDPSEVDSLDHLPVWGAVASNRASANLARRLGFVEVDQLWVLTRSDA